MRREIPVLSAVLLSFILLTGCSNPQESPYRTDFERARDVNESQYVKQVFSHAIDNGTISTTDYKESRQKLASCYKAAGIEFSEYMDDLGLGLIQFGFSEMSAEKEDALEHCDQQFDGKTTGISEAYRNQIINPRKEDMDKLIAECFVRKGLVSAGFSAQDYRDFIAANSAQCLNGVCTLPDGTTYNSSDNPPTPNHLTGDFILPGGKSSQTPEGQACTSAPLLGIDNPQK
ncbi:hypothetical protein [Schaalia sp. lx-100]|uniref:hypothetical protein n=1 Tax=Schaalia sp. lx-100 TaxID=2899081 RepID=UPI001E4DCDF2|nr:hypothetical protein [Schaalia sp. lx-100]MCD4557364.1 hypothetical protein [Schaalia sp. lx-100]